MVLGEMDVARVNQYRPGLGEPPLHFACFAPHRSELVRSPISPGVGWGRGTRGLALTRWTTSTRPGWQWGVGGWGMTFGEDKKRGRFRTDRGNRHFMAATRHVPRSQKDPRSWITRIQHPGSCRILELIFSFSHEILEILDPATATLPWDLRDLGSQTDNLPVPGDPGSSLSKIS